jgi:carbon monoxide dehydrogenase subunit G|tara:strand:- start:207 stop:638 length:432 start_codon:yes stop_codon:yes gene_type:complete
MAITQTLTDTFLQDCLDGAQNLGDGGDTLKIALYTSSATLGATTSAYTATNEVSGTGYTAGGATLASQAVAYDATNQVAFFDAADPAFTTATITARGALIYNNTKSNASIAVLDFGSDFTSTAGTFTVQLPSAAHNTAIIRIS